MRQRNVRDDQNPNTGQSKNDAPVHGPGERALSRKSVEVKSYSSLLHRTVRPLLALLIVYISVPFIVRLFPVLLAQIIYLNRVRVPLFVDLQHPSGVILNHTVNFYLTPEDGITVGIWHTVPESRWQETQGKDPSWYEAALADGNPVIVYLHGNGGTRAAAHRVELMKVLSAAGFHILALDYRGYGDSTGEPSEEGMTTDTIYLYEWVKTRSGKSPVCLWGHSLGTGVATNAAKKQQERGSPVDAVVLEAPYTNIREAGAWHPLGKIYHIFPGFEYFILDTMALNNIIFPNDENVKSISSPLLILHAEDDHIVPFEMGAKLYEIALRSQNSKDKVKFISFPGSLGYHHKNMYQDSKLPEIVREFLNSKKKV